MRGFALMRHAADLEEAWHRSQQFHEHGADILALRDALRLHDVRSYRGIGRFPFAEYHEIGPGWHGLAAGFPDPEPAARALLIDTLGNWNYEDAVPRSVLPGVQQARAVLDAIIQPSRFELVELCGTGEACAEPLGFDVGYWGGGNFSILCDAAIWPTWHPPTEEALEPLATFVAKLNEALLFRSREDASAYLAWYAGQTWAEQKPQDFQVVEIGRPPRRVVG